jgi:pimeloyl-ACP methyl ester carboxylesterase
MRGRHTILSKNSGKSMYNIELKGKGSPLLLLHGWGQSHESLLPLAELLRSCSSPHLLDLPGFGKSRRPEKVWNAFDYADSIVRYLDGYGIDKCRLLGHSFGGKICMCMALRYPERVEKMILIAASGLRPHRSLITRIKNKGIIWGGKLVKTWDRFLGTSIFSNQYVSQFGSLDYLAAGKMRPILVKSVNEDLAPLLPDISCKTLILWGKKDVDTPLEMGIRLSLLIPNSDFYSFAYHDHQIFQDAGAHLCATYIMPFLSENLLSNPSSKIGGII